MPIINNSSGEVLLSDSHTKELDDALSTILNNDDNNSYNNDDDDKTAFNTIIINIPDDFLEKEFLDAFLRHSPSLNVLGVSRIGNVPPDKAAELVKYANRKKTQANNEVDDAAIPDQHESMGMAISLEAARAARRTTLAKRRSSAARVFDAVTERLELAAAVEENENDEDDHDHGTTRSKLTTNLPIIMRPLRDSIRGGPSRSDVRIMLLKERLELMKIVVPRIDEASKNCIDSSTDDIPTNSTGQDVVPLSALGLKLHELWRVYLPLAMILDDLICAHYESKDDNDNKANKRAFILGINAPPGSGKSTLVQLLKFLLVEIAEFENRPTSKSKQQQHRRRVVVEVSQDDFYRTKADRLVRGISSRMDMEGMDTGLCATTLAALADRSPRKEPVDVPRFSKAKDDREPPGTTVVDANTMVDVILFEGWRVGIDHPSYAPLMNVPDFMLCIDADLDDVRTWKFEQVKRDAEYAGVPFDAEGLAKAWDEKILPVIKEYSDRVKNRADLVLSKGAGHVITASSFAATAHRRRVGRNR